MTGARSAVRVSGDNRRFLTPFPGWGTSCGRWPFLVKMKHWSLTTLREKLIKIGAKVVSLS